MAVRLTRQRRRRLTERHGRKDDKQQTGFHKQPELEPSYITLTQFAVSMDIRRPCGATYN
jgi:hypothetical protein